MKVMFLTGGYDGCYYVRCLLPLIQNGWWGAKTSLRSAPISPNSQFKAAMDADVIVFQRPMQAEMLQAAKLLKEKGKKIVYDNDDTYRKDSGLPKTMDAMLEARIDKKIDEVNTTLLEFVSIADLVTTTTQYLADEYLPINPKTIVLPNMVDPDDWSKPIRSEGEKIRIGLVGSVVNNQDYAPIRKILENLSERDDVQLVVFGLPPKREDTKEITKFYETEFTFWNSLNIEWQPFVPHEDYNDTLNGLALDIMLIPRADNYFNRCKSNVKFLEAAMCEIPVIAQGFADGNSPYQMPDDAKHMLIAHTEADWFNHLVTLIGDKKLRLQMGKDAHEYVLENYNIQNKANLWKEAYQSLI